MTIQDLGRWGFGSIGMPVAGVMDDDAARVANIFLGNDDNTPVLEMTLSGPELVFQQATTFVITGANFQPCLNAAPLELWTLYQAGAGAHLSFTGLVSGCRAYLAVAGGFEVPNVMGSTATYLRGKLGGYAGRALQAGDVLAVGTGSGRHVPAGFVVPPEYRPAYRTTLRVILGPQDEAFTQQGIDTLLTSEYRVTNDADRMGYRLDGPVIAHRAGADIISDGIALGAIQVPAHGKPIIMLADRQTIGGYAKIANVITVDIPSVAQMKPGDRLRFAQISLEEAQALYRERQRQLERLKQLVQTANLTPRVATYALLFNGQPYTVRIEDL